MPDATIKQAGGDFSSINAFIADAGTVAGDIGTIDGQWTVDDTTAVTWNEAVIITAIGLSKQSGRPWRTGDTTYRHRVTTGHAIDLTAAVDISEINIQSESTVSSDEILHVSSINHNTTVKNCQLGFTGNIIQQDIMTAQGIETTVVVLFEQCFFYDVGRTIYNFQNTGAEVTIVVNFNSCAALNIGANGAGADAAWFASNNNQNASTFTISAHNCLCTSEDVHIISNSAAQPDNIFKGTYCLSEVGVPPAFYDNEHASSVTTGTGFNYTWTEAADPGAGDFVGMLDITGGDYDPTLTDHPNNNAIRFHTVATGPAPASLTIPDFDITGQQRDKTVGFDVGPHAITVVSLDLPTNEQNKNSIFFPRPRRYRYPNQSMRFSDGALGQKNVFFPGDPNPDDSETAPDWWIDGSQITDSAITIACWFYAFSYPSTIDVGFISRQFSPDSVNHAWHLGYTTPGAAVNLRARVQGTITNVTLVATTDIVSRTNEWIHAAFTYDRGDATETRIYLDGVADGTDATDAGDLIELDGATVYIGNRLATSVNSSPDGCLAYPTIWKRALTAAEILRLAKRTCPTEMHPQDILMGYALNAAFEDHYDFAQNTHRGVIKADQIKIQKGKYQLGQSGPRFPPQGIAPPVMRIREDFLPWEFVSVPGDGQPTRPMFYWRRY